MSTTGSSLFEPAPRKPNMLPIGSSWCFCPRQLELQCMDGLAGKGHRKHVHAVLAISNVRLSWIVEKKGGGITSGCDRKQDHVPDILILFPCLTENEVTLRHHVTKSQFNPCCVSVPDNQPLLRLGCLYVQPVAKTRFSANNCKL